MTMASDCPALDTVCDAPGMAAAGVMMIGALLIGLVFFVGGPVAYLALKLVERK